MCPVNQKIPEVMSTLGDMSGCQSFPLTTGSPIAMLADVERLDLL